MRRWLVVLLAALVVAASVPAGPPSAAVAAAAVSYKVATRSLPVLKEPDQKAAVKGYLTQGATVQVTDEQFGWMKVSGQGLTGWAAGHYLVKSASGAGTPGSASSVSLSGAAGQKSGVITGSGVRVRSGPGTGYSVVGSVTTGDRVTVLKTSGQWSSVKTPGGLAGWVSSQYISAGGTLVSTGGGSGPAAGSAIGSLKGKRIVIDPGHGGNDPGMIGTTHKTEEKDLTLSTSKLLADELRARGASVVLTRTKDSEKPSLPDRVRIAEQASADAFVSIHYNSSPTKASGTLVFYYSKNKDAPLARAVEGPLEGLSLGTNGISFGDYHVLRENSLPSVLLELGFLSNAKDEAEVRTEKYQKEAAAAIAQGFEAYFARKST